MLSPETIFAILDAARAEGLEFIEKPPANMQTEFGFGRANGYLVAVDSIRTRIDEALEASAAQERRAEREF